MKHLGHVLYGKDYNSDLLALVGSSLKGTYETNPYFGTPYTVKTAADGRAIKLVHCTERDEIYEFESTLAYHRYKMGLPTPRHIEIVG